MDLVFGGDDAFSDVIGGRAPSFIDLSSGETAARPLVFAGENAEGAKHPPQISRYKRPARETQTEENASSPCKFYYENIYKTFLHTVKIYDSLVQPPDAPISRYPLELAGVNGSFFWHRNCFIKPLISGFHFINMPGKKIVGRSEW
jgi:hypothetical protein